MEFILSSVNLETAALRLCVGIGLILLAWAGMTLFPGGDE